MMENNTAIYGLVAVDYRDTLLISGGLAMDLAHGIGYGLGYALHKFCMALTFLSEELVSRGDYISTLDK